MGNLKTKATVLMLHLILSCAWTQKRVYFATEQVHAKPKFEFVRMCYFPSRAWKRTSIIRFDVEHINVTLCTHLVYAYGTLDANTNMVTALYAEDLERGGMFSKFNNIKRCNPRIKTLLAIGGATTDIIRGIKIFSGPNNTLSDLSKQAIQFAKEQGFDGLNVDWYHHDTSLKGHVVSLLQSLRDEINASQEKLLLTIGALGSPGKALLDLYDVPGIARYVDYVLLHTYYFMQQFSPHAEFTSALFHPENKTSESHLTVNWTVYQWIVSGMPISKIVVGVTGLGVRRVLQNRKKTAAGSPVTGEMRRGKYFNLEGIMTFSEICEMFFLSNTRLYFDQSRKNPYLVNGDEWIGYEDKTSLLIKVRWMMDLGTAGFVFAPLDADDFTGKFCNKGEYPLLSSMYAASLTRPERRGRSGIATKTYIKRLPRVKMFDSIFYIFMSITVQVLLNRFN